MATRLFGLLNRVPVPTSVEKCETMSDSVSYTTISHESADGGPDGGPDGDDMMGAAATRWNNI